MILSLILMTTLFNTALNCPGILWTATFRRNSRKIQFISYTFKGKHASWMASFQFLAKSLLTSVSLLRLDCTHHQFFPRGYIAVALLMYPFSIEACVSNVYWLKTPLWSTISDKEIEVPANTLTQQWLKGFPFLKGRHLALYIFQ